MAQAGGSSLTPWQMSRERFDLILPGKKTTHRHREARSRKALLLPPRGAEELSAIAPTEGWGVPCVLTFAAGRGHSGTASVALSCPLSHVTFRSPAGRIYCGLTRQ